MFSHCNWTLIRLVFDRNASSRCVRPEDEAPAAAVVGSPPGAQGSLVPAAPESSSLHSGTTVSRTTTPGHHLQSTRDSCKSENQMSSCGLFLLVLLLVDLVILDLFFCLFPWPKKTQLPGILRRNTFCLQTHQRLCLISLRTVRLSNDNALTMLLCCL